LSVGCLRKMRMRRGVQTHPVPHCSTLVTLSCSRPLSHASSSCLCLRRQFWSVAHDDCNPPYLDSPMLRYVQALSVFAVMAGAHVNRRVQMRFSG
jgi:hypothetical protein